MREIVFQALHVTLFGRAVLSPSYENHLYCYGEYQKEFDQLPPKVELVEGFPVNLNDMARSTELYLYIWRLRSYTFVSQKVKPKTQRPRDVKRII